MVGSWCPVFVLHIQDLDKIVNLQLPLLTHCVLHPTRYILLPEKLLCSAYVITKWSHCWESDNGVFLSLLWLVSHWATRWTVAALAIPTVELRNTLAVITLFIHSYSNSLSTASLVTLYMCNFVNSCIVLPIFVCLNYLGYNYFIGSYGINDNKFLILSYQSICRNAK